MAHLSHLPEAVWTSVGHQLSHWVQWSPITVTRDCSQLVICSVHVRAWVEWELGVRTLTSLAETCRVSLPLAKLFYLCIVTIIIVNCSLPEEPSNGTIVNYEMLNESVLEGTVVTYQCDNVLSLTGPNTITCTNDGVWSTEPDTIMCVLESE